MNNHTTSEKNKQIPIDSIPQILGRIRVLALIGKWEDSIAKAEKACDIAIKQLEALKIPREEIRSQ